MNEKNRQVIASRTLEPLNSRGKAVTVSLGSPQRAPDVDWYCPYWIEGLRGRVSYKAHGIDAIQALILALEGIRLRLLQSGRKFRWNGGVGDTGFPQYLPDYFGPAFSRHLEKLLEVEVTKFARAAKRRRGATASRGHPVRSTKT
jgi:hypothetical protein